MRSTILAACVLASLTLSAQAQTDPTPGYSVRQMPQGTGRQGGARQGAGAGHSAGRMRQRFDDANTTHDGKLTRGQVNSAGMPFVQHHFDEIDAGHKGYITMDDIRSYRQKMQAQRQGGGQGAPGGGAPGAGAQPGGPVSSGQAGDPDAQ